MYNGLGRIVTCLFLIVCTSIAVEIGAGPKVGLSVANLHGEDAGSALTKVGFCAGGFINVGLSDVISLQPEVLYIQKGARWTGNNPYFGTIEAKVSFDYLEIPVLVRLCWPTTGKTAPYFCAGGYYASNLSATGTVRLMGLFTKEEIEGIKSSDYGLVFGAGLEFLLGQGKLLADVRYALGLTTVDDTGYDVKTNALSIALGYSF
jgi:hypothetical protein